MKDWYTLPTHLMGSVQRACELYTILILSLLGFVLYLQEPTPLQLIHYPLVTTIKSILSSCQILFTLRDGDLE